MDQTDKLFGAFLRMIIRDLKEALTEEDAQKTRTKIEALLADMQAALED